MFDLATLALRPLYGGAAGPGHKVGGYPEFDGWPRWDSVTHQAMHEEWLRRAMDGGLRLIVVLAVNNEWMCSTLEAITPLDQAELIANPKAGFYLLAAKVAQGALFTPDVCRDMPAVDRQLNEARQMEAYIDQRAGGPGKGWYRIVGSPAEARQVIADGKLAVVLGVEVDSLFGCEKNRRQCTESFVAAQLAQYYDRGVRHVFPIHFYDNAFGGSASSNLLITKRWSNPIQTRDCRSLGYSYDNGRCNATGLTDLGKFFIRELARRGMIIDVDHMSELSFNDTMDILEPMRYPVVSGHTGFTAISLGDKNSEGNKTPRDLERIRKVGGMVAIIPHQGDLNEISTFGRPNGAQIPHSCGNSSETVVQAYLYAVHSLPGTPVGIGSDFNGFAGLPGPRLGDEACPGGIAAALRNRTGLRYPFTIRAKGVEITMNRSVVGNMTLDFNTAGLAHIGMLPDMIADFQVLGVTPRELDPLFKSAEGYIRLWEQALDPEKWRRRKRTPVGTTILLMEDE